MVIPKGVTLQRDIVAMDVVQGQDGEMYESPVVSSRLRVVFRFRYLATAYALSMIMLVAAYVLASL